LDFFIENVDAEVYGSQLFPERGVCVKLLARHVVNPAGLISILLLPSIAFGTSGISCLESKLPLASFGLLFKSRLKIPTRLVEDHLKSVDLMEAPNLEMELCGWMLKLKKLGAPRVP